jgi:hypothetical protein
MSVRRAASQLLPSRSIHLKIVPRPANLSESREIYRVLSRFGELSMYKSLKYEYHNPASNIALAIYRTPDSAQRALNASPIRFALEKSIDPTTDPSPETTLTPEDDDADMHTSYEPVPDSTAGIKEILGPSTLSVRTSTTTISPKSHRAPPMPFDPPQPLPHSPIPTKRTRWFQVIVDRSRVVHADYVERQPYWKYFQPMKSMAQEDLAKQVPHVGLSDVSKRGMNEYRTPIRVLRDMSEYVEKVMPSLRGVGGDGAGEVGFRRRRGV